MPANTIAKGESLANSFPKINQAIIDAFDAINKATRADQNSNDAIIKAKSVQNQIDTLIIESGTSDAETLQARTDLEGKTYRTIKERIDADQEKIKALQSLTDTQEQTIQSLTTDLSGEKTKTDTFIQEIPYEKIGIGGVKAKASFYLDNDNNIFTYTSDGKRVNIATVQQNNILDIGNFDTDTWIRGKEKVSIRAPKIDITPEMNPDGTASGPGREILHTGITAYHAKLHSNGTQALTKGNNNTLTITNDLQSCFPTGSVSGSKYTIPKAGMYSFMITLRPQAVTQQISMIQFGLEIRKGADVSYTDLGAEIASSAYQTAFICKTFMFQLSQGDVVAPFIKPFNEDMTIGAGTRFFCYYMGAMPTS